MMIMTLTMRTTMTTRNAAAFAYLTMIRPMRQASINRYFLQHNIAKL